MKGRAPDPKREKRGTGNRPAAGRQKAAPPAVVVDVAPCAPAPPPELAPPGDLVGAGVEAWRWAVAEMAGNRQLRQPDLVLLRAYCEAVYVHAEASAKVRESGVLVVGAMGMPVPNPMLRVQKDAAGTIRQLSDVLGLNPLSRIRAGIMEIAGKSMALELRDRLVADVTRGR